jgi:hypothetical protein
MAFIYMVRDPSTGLYLTRGLGNREMWEDEGAQFVSEKRAMDAIIFYTVTHANGNAKSPPPYEIVTMELIEHTVETIRLPDLTLAKRFLKNKWIWSGIGKFVISILMKGVTPRYIALLDGAHKPHEDFNTNSQGRIANTSRGKRTYVALQDENAAVALRLAHNDDILQLWDFKKVKLIEGHEDA